MENKSLLILETWISMPILAGYSQDLLFLDYYYTAASASDTGAH
jgi:hypothetical protein